MSVSYSDLLGTPSSSRSVAVAAVLAVVAVVVVVVVVAVVFFILPAGSPLGVYRRTQLRCSCSNSERKQRSRTNTKTHKDLRVMSITGFFTIFYFSLGNGKFVLLICDVISVYTYYSACFLKLKDW